MPIEPFEEPLDQGLVNKIDASDLEAGELTVADDAFYEPDTKGVRIIPGRTMWFNDNVAPGPTGAAGIHYLSFDDRDDALVVYRASNAIYGVDARRTTDPVAIATDEPLDDPVTSKVVSYNNRHFLFDGVNPGMTFREDIDLASSPQAYRFGFLPVTEPPTLRAISSGGLEWPNGTGYFWYWITEYDDVDQIESQYNADPVSQFIEGYTPTATAKWFIRVTFPNAGTPLNSRTKFFRVYRVKTETSDMPDLASGELVATVMADTAATVGYWDDNGDYPTSAGGPFHNTTDTPACTVTIESSTDVAGPAKAFDIPSGAYSYPSTFPDILGLGEAVFSGPDAEMIIGYQLVSPSGLQAIFPIAGLTIRVSGWSKSGPGYRSRIYATVSPDGGTTWLRDMSGWRDLPAYGSGIGHVVTFGGNDNPWYYRDSQEKYEWQTSDVAGKILLKINVLFSADAPTKQLGITDIDFQLHPNGVIDPPGLTPYPTIELTGLGRVDALGPPPERVSTGCIFEDSVVLNDLADRSKVVYSLVDEPEIFPPDYFVNIEEGDDIVSLASTNEFLMVGMTRHIVRVNYLPRETDFEFSRGRTYTIQSPNHGVIGPNASTGVYIEGQPAMIAFMDPNFGICTFDGYRVYQMTSGFDYRRYVNDQLLSSSILLNYPQWGALLFYYAEKDHAYLNKFLVFHYHPSQLRRNGRFKVTGPCRLPDCLFASVRADRNEGFGILTRGLGSTYIEGSGGNPDESATRRRFRIATREIYPRGKGEEGRTERMYIEYNNMPGDAVIGVKLSRTDTGEPSGESEDYVKSSQVTPGSGLIRIDPSGQLGESFQVEIWDADQTISSDFTLSGVTLFGDGYGPED